MAIRDVISCSFTTIDRGFKTEIQDLMNKLNVRMWTQTQKLSPHPKSLVLKHHETKLILGNNLYYF